MEEARILRSATVLLSSITMLFSIGLVGFSIRTLNEVSFVANVIGSRGLTTGALVMLLVGVAALATTPLGIFSVTTSRQTTAFIYTVMIFSVCLLSVVGGWIGFCLRKEVSSGVVLHWMNYSLSSEYGNPGAKELTSSWDQLQRKYSCCGVSFGKVAWTASQWFITYNHWPRPRVPESCCATCGDAQSRLCRTGYTASHENEKFCLEAAVACSVAEGQVVDERACQGWIKSDVPEEYYIHTKGCYEPLIQELLFYSRGTMLACFLMATLCIVNTCLFLLVHDSSVIRQLHGDELLL